MPLIRSASGEIWAALQRRQHGPPALLIHGAGGSHLSFPADLRRSTAIRAILPDLPGHGQSPTPAREKIADYAADMAALLDALDIDAAFVIGHSMGGAIALQMALDYPERALGLALICTGARLPVNPALIDGIVAAPEQTIKLLSRWMWTADATPDLTAATSEIMRATPPAVFQADLIACRQFDARERLHEVAAPTLILAGEDDKMTPLALSAELHAGIANSQLMILPGAGHMPQLEAPRAVAKRIESWLAGALQFRGWRKS